MKNNADSYISFSESNEDVAFRKEEFCHEVEKLKKSGEWNTNIADIRPFAVANYLGCIIRIYSSAVSTPVVDIKPETPSDRIISIAYTAIRGWEHYDATQRINIEHSVPNKVNRNELNQLKL